MRRLEKAKTKSEIWILPILQPFVEGRYFHDYFPAEAHRLRLHYYKSYLYHHPWLWTGPLDRYVYHQQTCVWSMMSISKDYLEKDSAMAIDMETATILPSVSLNLKSLPALPLLQSGSPMIPEGVKQSWGYQSIEWLCRTSSEDWDISATDNSDKQTVKHLRFLV